MTTRKFPEVEALHTQLSKVSLETKISSKAIESRDPNTVQPVAEMNDVQPPTSAMGKVAKGLHAGRIETDRASPTITVSVALWQQQQGRIADLEAQLAEARQEITRLKERKDHWKSRNEKHKADYRAMKERCKEAEETLETFTGAAEGRPAFEFDSDADKEQTVSDTLKEGNPTGTKTALALPADFDQRRSEFYDEYRPKVVKVKPGKSANGLPVTAQRPDLTVSALGLPRGQVFPSPLKGTAKPEHPSSPSKSRSASPVKRSVSPTKAVWR